MHLLSNTLLQGGKYRIVRFISSGGFGCTYEAEHIMLRKRVAIKEFFVKDFCNRDEATSRVTVGTHTKVALVAKLKKKFLEEAVALSKLHHENIVQVTDVFEDNGTAYYVMDYVNGRSIHDILKTQRTIPESQAVKYTCQVAQALKHVHAQNRLHLDIKPGNIMIDEHDNAILIDFGASKQYDEESGENTSTLLGKTPGYAPIEQMGNSVQNFTPATDIYSLGATLYKMLTGITPPEANLLVSDDEALNPLPSNITPATRKAVEQAMQVKRKDRPQSIDEFLAIIGTPVKEEDVKTSVPTPVIVGDETTMLDTVREKIIIAKNVDSTKSKVLYVCLSSIILLAVSPVTGFWGITESDIHILLYLFVAIVCMPIVKRYFVTKKLWNYYSISSGILITGCFALEPMPFIHYYYREELQSCGLQLATLLCTLSICYLIIMKIGLILCFFDLKCFKKVYALILCIITLLSTGLDEDYFGVGFMTVMYSMTAVAVIIYFLNKADEHYEIEYK